MVVRVSLGVYGNFALVSYVGNSYGTVLFLSIYFSRFNGVRDRIRVFVHVDYAIGIFRRKNRSIDVKSARKNLVGFYKRFRVFHSIISATKVLVHILYYTEVFRLSRQFGLKF